MNESDLKKFWDTRWMRDGVGGGLTLSVEPNARLQRDRRRLQYALDQIKKGATFKRVLEAGCGSGRLTNFYRERCKKIICLDISTEALAFHQQAFPELIHVNSPIGEYRTKPKERFDAIFTFTVVQHINKFEVFDKTLKNIQELLSPGGHYILHEDISAHVYGKQPSIHMNDFGVRTYVECLDKCELVFHDVFYNIEQNEFDLLAVFRRK